jgi:probable addiction module antidote protein
MYRTKSSLILKKFIATNQELDVFLEKEWDEYPEAFLFALNIIVLGYTGIKTLSEKSGLSRNSLYKSLNEGSSPRFETIYKILKALDIKVSFSSNQEI